MASSYSLWGISLSLKYYKSVCPSKVRKEILELIPFICVPVRPHFSDPTDFRIIILYLPLNQLSYKGMDNWPELHNVHKNLGGLLKTINYSPLPLAKQLILIHNNRGFILKINLPHYLPKEWSWTLTLHHKQKLT